MNRREIIEMLTRLRIPFTLVDHPPAETIEEIEGFHLPHAETIVKNLFLRDDKKREYFLLVLRKDKTVNLKELRALLGTRPLSFASESDLSRYLGVRKGSVTPFGVLNDTARGVQVILDRDILGYPSIGVHPDENTATLWLPPEELRRLIEDHGNPLRCLEV